MIKINNYLIIFEIFIFIIFLLSAHRSKNIFSPASIFCAVFLLSTVFAVYSKATWNFVMSSKTLWVLICGILSFVIPAYIVRIKYERRYRRNCEKDDVDFNLKAIKMNDFQQIIILFVCIILALIYFYCICRLANTYNILKVGSIYRNIIITGNKQIPMYGRLSLTILKSISIVLACIATNNYFAEKKKMLVSNRIILFCLAVYILLTIISGERTSLLRIGGVFILSFSVAWQRNNNFKKLVSIKHLAVAVIGTILFLYLFSAIRFFVGRSSNLNTVDYIALYVGGPLYNINYYVNKNIPASFSGKNTFIGLNNNLARLGFNNIQSIHREAVKIDSKQIYLGNVYTCFYDYYVDYGIVGVIGLTMIYSFIINSLYYKSKYKIKSNLSNVAFYSLFGTTVLFVSFTEQFYSSYFSISTIESIVVIYIVIAFVLSKKFSKLKGSQYEK